MELICCKDISGNYIGIKVVGTKLELTNPRSNTIIDISIDVAINKPNFGLKLIGEKYYFIGIDDVRGYTNPYFEFELNTINGGVNVRYDSTANKLYVQGGYPETNK